MLYKRKGNLQVIHNVQQIEDDTLQIFVLISSTTSVNILREENFCVMRCNFQRMVRNVIR